MRHHLVSGLHIAIITSISRKFGGSMLALDAFAICKKFGIPAILATFDHRHHYPNIGGDLRRLQMPDVRTPYRAQFQALDDLSQVLDEARANSKFVIIDVAAGFNLNHPMFEVFRNCGILNASTTAALLPIMSGDYGTCGALAAMRSFTSFGIRFDRGLIRQSSLHERSVKTDLSRLPNFPVWRVGCLSNRAMELINQELVRVGNPSHFDLPRLLRIQAQECVPASDRGPLQEAIDYFDVAQNAILRSILAPISKVIS